MLANSHLVETMIARELRWCTGINARAQGTRWLRFFGCVSKLGDGYIWYAMIALFALFGGQRGLTAALHMALIGVLSLVIYKSIKHISKRDRPLIKNRAINLSVAPLDEFSFPSGHTLHAVAFSLVACHYFAWLAVLLIPLTFLIALSRVVLGLHYPSDVLAAIALGFALYLGVGFKMPAILII
jgi:undecaprenyl-diphosphatase